MILIYIDPGTGSMLFALMLSISATVYFLFQKLLLQAKIILKSGKIERPSEIQEEIAFMIFTDDKRYWEMFKPICDEFERQKKQLVYWTCSEDDPGLEAEYSYVKREYIGDIYKASMRLNRMRAGICLTTTPGLDVYQWKRSKDTGWYVHLVHGAGDALAYKMLGLDSFDAVLTVGEHQVREIRKLEKVRGLKKKEIFVAGEPHMDTLRKRLKDTLPKTSGQTTVLLAPSWGESAILSRYGVKIIDALLQTGYRIVIRPHPQSVTSEKEMLKKLMDAYPESDLLTWNFDNDNFAVLNESDIMISDFSSVIWDYTLVFDKPVIFADVSFDPAPYDLAWTEDERWDFRALREVGYALTEAELGRIKEIIDRALASGDLGKGREQVRKDAWGNIGKGAVTAADYMIHKYEMLYSKEADNKIVEEAG